MYTCIMTCEWNTNIMGLCFNLNESNLKCSHIGTSRKKEAFWGDSAQKKQDTSRIGPVKVESGFHAWTGIE